MARTNFHVLVPAHHLVLKDPDYVEHSCIEPLMRIHLTKPQFRGQLAPKPDVRLHESQKTRHHHQKKKGKKKKRKNSPQRACGVEWSQSWKDSACGCARILKIHPAREAWVLIG